MLYLFVFYLLFLIAFVAYSAAGIYHLWRFGFVGDLTRPMIVFYSLIGIIIIIISLVLIVLEARIASV